MKMGLGAPRPESFDSQVIHDSIVTDSIVWWTYDIQTDINLDI